MGTYYKIVNKSRREFIRPATFGQTLKVQEFTEEPAGIMEALALLLLEDGGNDIDGRWASEPVVLASVYGKRSTDGLNLYERVASDPLYNDIGLAVLRRMVESQLTRRRLVERARAGHAQLQANLDEIGVGWRKPDSHASDTK